MRILHFTNSLSSGGAEIFLVNLLIELKKSGHDVSLATYAGATDKKGENLLTILRQNNIPYFDLKAKSPLEKVTLPVKLNKLIDAKKFEVIHSHLDQSDFFLYLSSLIYFSRQKPIYARTLHSINFIKRIPKFIHNKMMKFFKLNICVSKTQEMNFKKQFTACNFHHIPNGINIKSYQASDQEYDQQNFKIAFIGSFDKRLEKFMKGQDYALKVVKKIKTKKFILNFYGGGASLEEVKKYALLNKIQNVKFHGQTSDISKELQNSNFFLSCSEFEGLPISVIEACLSGLIKILPNQEEFKVFDSKSTIFYNRQNPEELVSILSDLENIFTNLNQQAVIDIKYFQEKFNIKNTAIKYINSYELI